MKTLVGPHRDYMAEVAIQVEKAIYLGGTGSARTIANRLVAEWRMSDEDLLHGFLDIQAEQILWAYISGRDRSDRAHVHANAEANNFAAATRAHKRGDSGPLKKFLNLRYVTDSVGTRKYLRDLGAEDLTYVAAGYEGRARSNLMRATFMRQLSRHIGDGVVSDHFTDQQLADMWREINRTSGTDE